MELFLENVIYTRERNLASSSSMKIIQTIYELYQENVKGARI